MAAVVSFPRDSRNAGSYLWGNTMLESSKDRNTYWIEMTIIDFVDGNQESKY